MIVNRCFLDTADPCFHLQVPFSARCHGTFPSCELWWVDAIGSSGCPGWGSDLPEVKHQRNRVPVTYVNLPQLQFITSHNNSITDTVSVDSFQIVGGGVPVSLSGDQTEPENRFTQYLPSRVANCNQSNHRWPSWRAKIGSQSPGASLPYQSEWRQQEHGKHGSFALRPGSSKEVSYRDATGHKSHPTLPQSFPAWMDSACQPQQFSGNGDVKQPKSRNIPRAQKLVGPVPWKRVSLHCRSSALIQ